MFTGQSASDLPIALQCLDALIGKRRRQVPTSRVFAFVKRLSTLALQMDCHGSLALLALINNILSVSQIIIDCVAGEIIRLVVSVCVRPFVCGRSPVLTV